MKRISVVVLVVCFLLGGCLKDKPDRLSDERIKELAWNSLNPETRDDVIGSKEDIGYRLEPSGVTVILNNSPSDVWKQAEVNGLNDSEIQAAVRAGGLQSDSLPKEVAAVSFKSMLLEELNRTYSPYRVFIDPITGNVLGEQPGRADTTRMIFD